MTEQIRTQLAAGVSPDSVRAWLRSEYGAEVDAVPPAEGFGLLAWVMPALALLAAGRRSPGGCIGARAYRAAGKGRPTR